MKCMLISVLLISCGGSISLPQYKIPSNYNVLEFSESCDDGNFHTMVIFNDDYSEGTMILSGTQDYLKLKFKTQEIKGTNSVVLLLDGTSEFVALSQGQALATVDLSQKEAVLRWTAWDSLCL